MIDDHPLVALWRCINSTALPALRRPRRPTAVHLQPRRDLHVVADRRGSTAGWPASCRRASRRGRRRPTGRRRRDWWGAGELQVLAQRWLNEAVQDAVGQAKSAVAFKPKIEIGLQGISLGIEVGDTSKLDLGGVKTRRLAKMVKFYDQATGAPGAISSISEKVGFQARFLTALGTSMATMTGAEFLDSLPLTVPES